MKAEQTAPRVEADPARSGVHRISTRQEQGAVRPDGGLVAGAHPIPTLARARPSRAQRRAAPSVCLGVPVACAGAPGASGCCAVLEAPALGLEADPALVLAAEGCPGCLALHEQLGQGERGACASCGAQLRRGGPVGYVPALLGALHAVWDWRLCETGARSQDLSGVLGTGNRGTKGVGRAEAPSLPRHVAAPRAWERVRALRGEARRVVDLVLARGVGEVITELGGRARPEPLEARLGLAWANATQRTAWERHALAGDHAAPRDGARVLGEQLLEATARCWDGGAWELRDWTARSVCAPGVRRVCGLVGPVAVVAPAWRPEGEGWVLLVAYARGTCRCVRRGASGRSYAREGCGHCKSSGDPRRGPRGLMGTRVAVG